MGFAGGSGQMLDDVRDTCDFVVHVTVSHVEIGTVCRAQVGCLAAKAP